MSDRKPPDPRQWAEAARWLARADEDLGAAEALVGLSPPIIGPAAFHCQQAAEKMAKAALIALSEPPPRSHDIEALGRRLLPLDRDLGDAFLALGGLGSWYMVTRYPDAGLASQPNTAEVRQSIGQLQQLRTAVEGIGGLSARGKK